MLFVDHHLLLFAMKFMINFIIVLYIFKPINDYTLNIWDPINITFLQLFNLNRTKFKETTIPQAQRDIVVVAIIL